MKKTMTKYDLQTGMIVENREGTRYLVLKEPHLINVASGYSAQELVFMSKIWWDCGENYGEDLTNVHGYKNIDIVKVYRHKHLSTLNDIFTDDHELELIWSREEEKIEMTLKQVADKLGIDVTKLRIKD